MPDYIAFRDCMIIFIGYAEVGRKNDVRCRGMRAA